MKPLLRGLVLGGMAYVLGAALVVLARGGSMNDEIAVTIGFVTGLGGWLVGVGAAGAWGRDWLGHSDRESPPRGWHRYLAFTTDHKVIGVQYLVTFVIVFLLAGVFAMLIRAQLLAPGGHVLSPARYNEIMSLHGILMIAVAVAAVLGGFGNYFVPLMIGAEDMAFPRVNALSFWLVPPVALAMLTSPLLGGFDAGWTAYPPLSEINGHGQVLFALGIIVFGISSILGGLNFLVTITTMRAPGMTWGRLPIFVWSVFAAGTLSLLVTQFFAASMLLILLGREAGTIFFNARGGGSSLLYENLFWFYSHPAVYIMILPGLGILLEVLAQFSRKPLFGYRLAVGGFLGIVLMSTVVWAHHMFVSGMPNYLHVPFLVTTELISIPTGLVFLSAIGTIWRGRLWLQAPMLFGLATVINFLIGGVTGIFLADVATDVQLHGTYFVVAHFHYTIMGGEIFALFAGIYYWFPKVTGRRYHEGLGKIHAWWMWLAFNATFLPMFWAGMHGMNRRIATYQAGLGLAAPNRVSSIAAFALGASFLLFVVNVVWSLARGERVPANPWGASTMEWLVTSPPPVHNFAGAAPLVLGDPYPFGTGTRHAELVKAAPTDGAGEVAPDPGTPG